MRNLKKTCMMLGLLPMVMLFTATDAFGQSARSSRAIIENAPVINVPVQTTKKYQAPTAAEQLSNAKAKLTRLQNENASVEVIAEVEAFITLVENGEYKPNEVQGTKSSTAGEEQITEKAVVLEEAQTKLATLQTSGSEASKIANAREIVRLIESGTYETMADALEAARLLEFYRVQLLAVNGTTKLKGKEIVKGAKYLKTIGNLTANERDIVEQILDNHK